MKKCGRCGENKKLSEFNKSKYTKTGYRSQCKDCMCKERVERKDYSKKWRSTPERKAWYAQYRRDRYQKDKRKVRARNLARSLKREPCEKCGNEKVQAHHDDYSKPLEVRWLCSKHHKQWHKDNGEAKNP